MQASQKFSFHVKTLEVADGKDDFLRGRPDPAIVLAVYAIHGVHARCMGRSIWRFNPERNMPCTVAPTEGQAISKQIESRVGMEYVVVAASVEENDGDGVRAIYGALEHHAALSLWPLAESDPSPVQLLELSTEAGEWLAPQRIGLLADGIDIAKSFGSDTWVGAVSWRIPGAKNGVHEYRLPFRHHYGGNNWTAIAEAHIG